VRSLLEFTAVVLALDSGISDSPDRYPVRLRAKIGKDFVLITPPHFSKARKQAEYLSRSLRLPLADSTSDRETFVSPEQAGDSLRGRLLSGEPETERATPPPGMLCEVTESPEATRIIIPGPRFPRSAVLAAVAPAVVLLLVIAAVGPGSLQNASSRGLPLAFLILILILGIPVIVAGVNLIVGSTRRRTVVRVSSAGLVIERRSAWRTRSKTVAASDILDIDRSTFEHTLQSRGNGTAVLRHLATSTLNKGIVVKSRQEVITFGEELPTGELTYLRCVLRNALAGHWR
jgi:hypothetical protein